MTPARILTACIGISAYRPAVLEPGERPLQFFADSARDLSGIFAAIWPGDDSRHVLVVDEAATLANVGALIAAETDAFDYFIFYLGGHGRVGGGGFEFQFFGDEPVTSAGSSGAIDAIVAMPKADNILLLLDSDCAGKYGDETVFFRSGTARGMRACITSCSANQRSWEDPRLRRSLFLDAIIKALAADIGRESLARNNVRGLFKEITSDVTRHAAILKARSAQEPQLIGLSRAAPARPVDRRRSAHKRSRSIAAVPVLRHVLIALASIGIIAVSAAGLMMVSWHPVINDSGYVELRAGPAWLSFFDLGARWVRVESDVTSADLINETSSQRHVPLLPREESIRPWSGVNAAQVRSWADVFIDEYLNAEAGARWRVRLGYGDAVARLTIADLPNGAGGRIPDARPARIMAADTASELAAEAKILDPSRPIANIWSLNWRGSVAAGSCAGAKLAGEASNQIENYQHFSTPGSFGNWLRGLVLTAAMDDAIGIEEVVQSVEMFAAANSRWRRDNVSAVSSHDAPAAAVDRAGWYAGRPAIGAVAALASIASAIAARRIAASDAPITSAERARLQGILTGCSDIAMPVLAALGNHGEPEQVIAWARTRSSSDPGRLALRELAAHGALPDGVIMGMLDAQGFSDSPDERKQAFAGAREWLLAISDVMPLPPDALARLVDYANERLSGGDIEGARQVLSIVLRSPSAVRPPLSTRTGKLIDRIVPPLNARKMPSRNVLPINTGDLELLGLLARSGTMLTEEQYKMVMNVLKREDYKGAPRVSFSESDKDDSQHVTQVAIAVNSAHLLALSRFIIGAKEEDGVVADLRTLNFLRQAISDAIRFGVPLRRIRDVLTATAIVQKRYSGHDIGAARVSGRLRRLASDAAARRAEVEITKAALTAMPRPYSDLVVDGLRDFWRREQEPETKLALAEIIIGATANLRTELSF